VVPLLAPGVGVIQTKEDNMTDAQDLQLRWQRFSDALAEANRRNKMIVFDALEAAGITHVAVGFDGEGDQGQIDGAAAHTEKGAVEFPETVVKLRRAGYGEDDLTTHEMPLREAVETLCYDYLEQEYAGWENNDGALGEFAFHVEDRRIALDFNGRFTDYAHYSHTF
jgi:hypothetical protein